MSPLEFKLLKRIKELEAEVSYLRQQRAREREIDQALLIPQAAARLGGITSPAKAAAARINGRKGGRPVGS